MSKKYIFRYRVKLCLLCIGLITALTLIMIIGGYAYINKLSEEIFEYEKKSLTREILNRFEYVDKMYLLGEKETENRVVKIGSYVNKLYEEKGEDAFNSMDLEKFKSKYPDIDLYIIDEDNIIKESTIKEEVGLDFNKYPKFIETLNKIRDDGNLYMDRSVKTLNSEHIRRYMYLPTRDKKYIIELSTDMSKVNKLLCEEGMIAFVEDVIEENKFVKDIRLYDEYGHLYIDNRDGQLKRGRNSSELKKAIEENRIIEVKRDNAFYEHVPYCENGILTGFIVLYDETWPRAQLWNIIMKMIGVSFLLIILVICFSLKCVNNISKPIEDLVNVTESVTEGNFNVRANTNYNDEIRIVCKNLNKMLDHINQLRKEREEKERILREQNSNIIHKNEEISALYEQTKAMNDELNDLLEKNQENTVNLISVLVNAIDAKDEYLRGHCSRVKDYSVSIAKKMNLSQKEIMDLKYGSILHDIGKIGIAEKILNKDGRFTDDEYEVIKGHPQIGYGIIEDIKEFSEAKRIVYEHHERIDGRGYPNGLKGGEIYKLSKIVAVADAYDAMTSKRSYRKIPLTIEEAIEELIKNMDGQFDREVVEVFVEYLKESHKEVA
ncbi:MAG: HD domain-containing protein [Anaeromicrobium sp.]|jgi:HD-GYP domain-containing protein (c-di-GMP phosphodiesterase class II)|uniref:HD domain-containing phosphohydrolase n=1 Tax=Anaeromicrobium sp. TaxID=1929132 RepID=UPI0025E994F2|nr:HD domain-containing phosphohydrolase [Anaeromicrobium sp.]MCT4593330.1 HD domain-containing protein [Anaeromicrobium sp.]